MRPSVLSMLFALATASLAPIANAETAGLSRDFLAALGGSSEVKKVGESSTVARPLLEFESEIIDARFFKHKGSGEPFREADRGLELFRQACTEHQGSVLAVDDKRTWEFRARLSGHLTQPSGHKHQWRAKAAICENEVGEPFAGYLAIIQDNSEIASGGDAGSRVFAGLFGMRTPTAIYLIKPDRIPSKTEFEREQLAQEQEAQLGTSRIASEREQAEAFRENLAIGDATNCGAVIEIRGPMAEIAVPVNRQAPNGERTFWTHVDRLSPAGYGVCTYGL